MAEFLEIVSRLAVLVFVVTCMVTAGLGLTARAVVAPLRRVRVVLLAVAANFVLAPALAFALTATIPLERPHAIGLLLLGGAAGAPFLPKLAELARGDVAFSVGLMLLLMVGSVIFMPVVLPLMIPGLAADPWPILRPLLLTMLVPLGVGMFVRSRSERWSSRLQGPFRLISNASMILALLLLIGLNIRAMLGTFGSGAAAVAVVFVALSILVGYGLGGPSLQARSVLGLGTGQRNIAAALVLATQNFPEEPGVVVMLLVSTLAGLVVILLAARRFANIASIARDTGASDPANGGPVAVQAGVSCDEEKR